MTKKKQNWIIGLIGAVMFLVAFYAFVSTMISNPGAGEIEHKKQQPAVIKEGEKLDLQKIKWSEEMANFEDIPSALNFVLTEYEASPNDLASSDFWVLNEIFNKGKVEAIREEILTNESVSTEFPVGGGRLWLVLPCEARYLNVSTDEKNKICILKDKNGKIKESGFLYLALQDIKEKFPRKEEKPPEIKIPEGGFKEGDKLDIK
ncbi:MAG: hypothetical protein WC438_02885 [Candidatus Pacearchaeota archaeon]